MISGSNNRTPLPWLTPRQRAGLDLTPPKVIPLSDALRPLGLSQARAYRLLAEKRFPVPALRVGSRWMVRRAELEAFLESPTWETNRDWSTMTDTELHAVVRYLSTNRKTVPAPLALELAERLTRPNDPP